MKTELTIKQSQRLIELGVSAETATGQPATVSDKPNHKVYRAIFTLTDLLGILPKEAIIKDDCGHFEKYYLGIEWSSNHEWLAFHANTTRVMSRSHAPELIDALFRLTLWCIENKHLQL